MKKLALPRKIAFSTAVSLVYDTVRNLPGDPAMLPLRWNRALGAGLVPRTSLVFAFCDGRHCVAGAEQTEKTGC